MHQQPPEVDGCQSNSDLLCFVCQGNPQNEVNYGIVLALQVIVPHVSVQLVNSSVSDYPDGVSGLFCLSLADVQATLAIEEDEHDMR